MTDGAGDIDDEELVRRVRAGDERAATALYARHAPLLNARAKRRLGGPLRRKLGASDIVQDTYAAAFAALDAFEDQGPGSFRRWLESILAHKTADQVKRHLRAGRDAKREVSTARDAPDPDPVGREPTPSVVAIREEDRASLRRALARMAGDDGVVLALVHEQGKDFAEAARILGRSPEAARKLYGRAVLRLGRELRRPS